MSERELTPLEQALPFFAACPYCTEIIEFRLVKVAVGVGLHVKAHASADFEGKHRCQAVPS